MIDLILGQFLPYIIGGVALLATLFGIRYSGKQAAKQAQERKWLEATLKGVQDAKEVRGEIDAMDDAAIRDRAVKRMRDTQGRK